jgi:hypothetical protein
MGEQEGTLTPPLSQGGEGGETGWTERLLGAIKHLFPCAEVVLQSETRYLGALNP